MCRTRKGNHWYFDMEAQVGVDAECGLVHAIVGTSVNAADPTHAHHLLHVMDMCATAFSDYTSVVEGRLSKRNSSDSL